MMAEMKGAVHIWGLGACRGAWGSMRKEGMWRLESRALFETCEREVCAQHAGAR